MMSTTTVHPRADGEHHQTYGTIRSLDDVTLVLRAGSARPVATTAPASRR
jgi:hypothetical protein